MRQQPRDLAARLPLAEQYTAAGQTYAAIEQWQVARALGAKDENVAMRLAQAYTSVYTVEEAERVLTEAAVQPGASPDLRQTLAQTRLTAGDFRGAASALRPLLPQWASLPPDRQRFLVRALLLAGDTEQAAKLFPATLDAEWLALRGLWLQMTGRNADAVKALKQSVQHNPADTWNAYLLGRARYTLGDSDPWREALARPDAPPLALLGAARVLMAQSKTEEAARMLSLVPASEQKSAAFWKQQAALERLRKRMVPQRIAEGYAAYYAGDPWQAERTWQQIAPQAQGEDARELFAGIYNSAFLRQDVQTAFRAATDALKRFPNDPYFMKRRAEILLGQNRMPEAQAQAEALQKLAPPEQSAEVAELLSRIALDAGKGDLLRQNAELQSRLQPSDPTPSLHLAEWQAQQGRTPENLERTLKLYQQAIAVAPQNAEAQAHAGILLADLKRDTEAIAALQRALTLDPQVMEGTPNVTLVRLYQQQRQAESEQGVGDKSAFGQRGVHLKQTAAQGHFELIPLLWSEPC